MSLSLFPCLVQQLIEALRCFCSNIVNILGFLHYTKAEHVVVVLFFCLHSCYLVLFMEIVLICISFSDFMYQGIYLFEIGGAKAFSV